ncbi:MAG TPA: hypothetical protein VGJ66_26390 [Pyrinomonadaceae bacterium]|jgi:hypothetical protein
MNEFDPESWKNKVVFVYLRNPGAVLQNGIAVVEPKLQNIQGQKFLVGKMPEDSREWMSGLPIMVVWEEIIHIAIFDSLEDYYARLERVVAYQRSENKDPVQ